MDCGPTCLRMIAKHYGQSFKLQELRQLSGTTRAGSGLLGISEAAEKIGFRTIGVKLNFERLLVDVPLPCIAHWNQNHFVVIYKIKNNTVWIADPAHGLLKYSKADFLTFWKSDASDGILLLLEPTPGFNGNRETADSSSLLQKERVQGFAFLYSYLHRYKKMLAQLIIGLFAGSLLQLVFPFLTQSIVDIGVEHNDIHFVYLILFAQLMLFAGKAVIDVLRSWILLHISSRINISLISDFFVKLMKLPISFFDIKMTGDILQRINDHHRIENFLTSTSLNVLFSAMNLIVFSFVLAYYNGSVFLIFLIGSSLYFLWISFFLKRRAEIDFKSFTQNSKNQSKVMELITGMQEIKLQNAERQKRWQWENIQVRLFKISSKGLVLEQIQNTGSALINELKNSCITIVSAKLVIDGQISLGMMLSISYIIGQLNSPVIQLVSFTQSLQDARLSLERLSEIHSRPNEETVFNECATEIGQVASIETRKLCFRYAGSTQNWVLKDLNLVIPARKVTAIVGSSGSGKTTLLKILLKFYDPTSGEILLNSALSPGNRIKLNSVSSKVWRNSFGVVMQEGFIFSDSIAHNITVGAEDIDTIKLRQAVKIANIGEFIESLPLGYNTKIGMEGTGISTGQKQRILIARAVYKNPDYLFFDEATSALDATNEKIIMNNLGHFFKGKTVVIIAHRLSTVKNADQIIVLEKGKIAEQGNHACLASRKGTYYNLVKNQLELGN